MIVDRMYCVEWDQGTGSWRLIWDRTDRERPAAYYTAVEAEERRSKMALAFPQYKYRVVGYEHHEGGRDGGRTTSEEDYSSWCGNPECPWCRPSAEEIEARQQGSNDGQSDTSLADGPSTLPEPTIGAERRGGEG